MPNDYYRYGKSHETYIGYWANVLSTAICALKLFMIKNLVWLSFRLWPNFSCMKRWNFQYEIEIVNLVKRFVQSKIFPKHWFYNVLITAIVNNTESILKGEIF